MELVRVTGKITEITANVDFYDAGFSSINALQLLMELEAAFDVSIPDEAFITARTCALLDSLITRLREELQ